MVPVLFSCDLFRSVCVRVSQFKVTGGWFLISTISHSKGTVRQRCGNMTTHVQPTKNMSGFIYEEIPMQRMSKAYVLSGCRGSELFAYIYCEPKLQSTAQSYHWRSRNEAVNCRQRYITLTPIHFHHITALVVNLFVSLQQPWDLCVCCLQMDFQVQYVLSVMVLYLCK